MKLYVNAITKHVVAFILFGLFMHFPVGGTALTVYAGNDYYRYEDPIDSSKTGTDLLFDFGFGLENIGGSGLSLITDWMASNVFFDRLSRTDLRLPYQLNTGYIDWRSAEGKILFRVGRQQYTNLSIETFDIDGLRAGVRPTEKVTVNAAVGMYVPTPFSVFRHATKSRRYQSDTIIDGIIQPVLKDTLIDTVIRKFDIISDPAKNTAFSIDGSFSIIPFTTITAAASLVPKAFDKTVYGFDTIKVRHTDFATYDSLADSVIITSRNEKEDFRLALGADISPVWALRFKGSMRFSLIQKGIDRFDGRLILFRGKPVELSTYITGEKGRIDSTNYFSVMFHRQITEFGISLNAFPGGESFLSVDYHITGIVNEGLDHFLSFDAANRYFNAGIVLGAGFHGLILKPSAGFRLPFLKIFTLQGAGEYSYIDETDKDNIYHLLTFSGGLKIAVRKIGLTIFPRAEYITNRYYTRDIRLLLTTNLLINKFWGAAR